MHPRTTIHCFSASLCMGRNTSLNHQTYQHYSTMMKSVEKITSKVSIKPSIPTPEHLRSFKLSLLDQISPPDYVSIILFYSASPTGSTSSTLYEHQAHVSDHLKKSLSKTLTHFYPIAGRLKDNLLVDCNDEGIEYFECRLNGNMSEFMKQDQLHHLLPPYDLHSTLKTTTDNDPLLIAQVNLFGCGGIAICVCISHKIGDTATFTTFINTWASITREPSAEAIVNLTFDSAILYPPREAISLPYSPAMSKHDANIKQAQKQGQAEKLVIKRFVFDGAKIAILRARYGNLSKEMFPTCVEAVIALIWKTAMAASSSPRPSFAILPLDMRRRLDPPLPEQSFGNLTIMSTATPFISKSTGEVDLEGSLRKSIRKINKDFLKVLQGDEGFLKFQDYLMKSAMVKHGKQMEEYMFASWCRFPLYEADFGWGKPNWVATALPPFFKNTCVLIDNRTGDGIEAIICLVEEHMAIFERNQELLDFTSFSMKTIFLDGQKS